jgi:hypothetical protein
MVMKKCFYKKKPVGFKIIHKEYELCSVKMCTGKENTPNVNSGYL